MTDTDATATTAIDREVCERVADDEGVEAEDLAATLDVVAASLTDEHSTYEREYDYTTVEGTRIYFADAAAWDGLASDLDLDSSLASAVRDAHRAQAAKLLDDAAAGHRAEVEDGTPVVAGVDTAEEMN
ncbi:hypothetical protein [Halomarina ordinaria]|uniref:DUF8048 domain-containing protein n=1 Tax=Halomarina ordinaria TaxID=3033939 RepID=A0ABD5U770_9EURY|nr:hypothetical protein [Halomarina sp. PSRA2]